MDLHVSHNGQNKEVIDLHVSHESQNKKVLQLWQYQNGVAKEILLEAPFPQPSVSTLSATSITSSAATLRASLSGVSGYTARYRFQYRVQGAGTWITTTFSNTTTNGTKTQGVSGLSPSTTYEYRAQAVNLDDPDNIQTGNTVTFATTALQPPTGVTIFMSGTNSQVAWTAPSGSPLSYNLQYRIASGVWNVLASGVGTTSHDFNACSLGSNGQNLTIRVMANYSGGSSAWAESAPEAISGCF